jgi:hypothetical protein
MSDWNRPRLRPPSDSATSVAAPPDLAARAESLHHPDEDQQDGVGVAFDILVSA